MELQCHRISGEYGGSLAGMPYPREPSSLRAGVDGQAGPRGKTEYQRGPSGGAEAGRERVRATPEAREGGLCLRSRVQKGSILFC